jgi:PAS domain S-box-containing protein
VEDTRGSRTAPENDELLRLIVESATDFAIFSIDPTGAVTSWNPGAERVLGFAEADILGRSADVIFTPEDRAAGVPEQERRQARELGRAEDERWTMRKDGSRFWASGLAMPLADPGVGFVKILRDRTEGHLAEARLRESEERFRLLAISIPQLVFLTHPNGSRTWGSPQWIEFTGLSLDESLGLGWLDAIHPEDREATQAAWADAQRSGEYYAQHRVRRVRDGEYRWHQTRARPVDGGDSDWVGAMTDVHDLLTLKDRQQVLLAELQHRTRNLLAVVQATARQTARSSKSVEAFTTEFERRLRALGRVQSVLARADEEKGIDLGELVTMELDAHGDGERTVGPRSRDRRSGFRRPPPRRWGSPCTNSPPTPSNTAPWLTPTDVSRCTGARMPAQTGVAMPDDGAPKRRGYGAELIERALPYQLGAKTRLEFGADGVRCRIVVPLTNAATGREHG